MDYWQAEEQRALGLGLEEVEVANRQRERSERRAEAGGDEQA